MVKNPKKSINIIDLAKHLCDLTQKSKKKHKAVLSAYHQIIREHCGELGRTEYGLVQQAIYKLLDYDFELLEPEIQLTSVELMVADLPYLVIIELKNQITKLLEYDSLMEDMECHEVGFMIGEFEKYLML